MPGLIYNYILIECIGIDLRALYLKESGSLTDASHAPRPLSTSSRASAWNSPVRVWGRGQVRAPPRIPQ